MSKIHNIGTEMQKIVIKNKKLSSYNITKRKFLNYYALYNILLNLIIKIVNHYI